MKRIFWLAAILSFAFAMPAWAKPSVSSAISPHGWRVHTIKFDSTTDDSPAFGLGPSCSVRVTVYGGSNSVSLYQVPTQDTAASSGTLIGTYSAVSTATATFQPGQGFAKAVSASGSDGTVMEVWCSNTQVSSGGGGAFAGTADYLVAGEDGVADAADPRDGDGNGTYDDAIACNATFGACLFQSSTGNVWTYDQTNTEWTCATCRRRIIAPVDGKLFFSGTVQTDCLDLGATSNVERLDADVTAACNSTGGGISLGTPSSPPTIEVFCHATVNAYSGTEGVDLSITMDDGSTALTTLSIPDTQSTVSTTGESVCLSTPVRMTAGAANSSYRIGLYARDGTNCQNGSGCAAPNGSATGALSLEIMYP